MTRSVELDAGTTALSGDLTVPAEAAGLVVFVHGSGSSRHSPRNRAVARTLHEHKLATLLFDLLSQAEEDAESPTGGLRFDIGLLTERLLSVLDELVEDGSVRGLPIGLFGASTGAATALAGAARRPEQISAVVPRGGRPDLAGDELEVVRAPALFLVGERDQDVLRLNQRAAAQLSGGHELRIIAGAGHLFEEPGALDGVATLAANWLRDHLG